MASGPPPRYTRIQPGSTTIKLTDEEYDEHMRNLPRPHNHLFVQKEVGDAISDVYHIDTDLEAPLGRFQTSNDGDKSVNLYLEATRIRVLVFVSGSKRANIKIFAPAGGANALFTRSSIIFRIVQVEQRTAAIPTPRAKGPLVNLSISQPGQGCSLISLNGSETLTGLYSGPCVVLGRMLNQASNILSKPRENRWLVLPYKQLAGTQHDASSASGDRGIPDATSTTPSSLDDLSSITFTCSDAGSTNGLFQRRMICWGSDYQELREKFRDLETPPPPPSLPLAPPAGASYHKLARRAGSGILAMVLIVCVLWLCKGISWYIPCLTAFLIAVIARLVADTFFPDQIP